MWKRLVTCVRGGVTSRASRRPRPARATRIRRRRARDAGAARRRRVARPALPRGPWPGHAPHRRATVLRPHSRTELSLLLYFKTFGSSLARSCTCLN